MNTRRFLRSRTLLPIATLCWLATGCYLPLSKPLPDSRGSFAEWPESFESGKTTRTDILLALGEPDAVSDDESLFTYRQSTIDGIIIVSQCGGFELTSDTVLRVTFDEQGILDDIGIFVES